MSIKNFLLASLLIFIVLMFSSCSKNQGFNEPKTDSITDTLSLPGEMESNIKTTLPISGDLDDELILAGKVTFDPNEISKIFPLVNGIMSKVYVNTGDVVSKGQILGEVYSNDFANALSDYEKAQSQLDNSKKNYERVEKLFASSISSQKDIEQAKRDYDQGSI